MAFQFNSYREDERERLRAAAAQLDALRQPEAYSSPWTQKVQQAVANIEERKPFAYDVNGDALYQQYKSQYMNAGRQAMADTIGKAASMTGGYGNSYAASAGNQAYQAYLGQLNNMVPQLYSQAYARYQQEGQDLKDIYSMYGEREATDYGRYRDRMSDYRTDRDYLAGRLDAERNWDYGLWSDEEQRRYQNYQLQQAELAAMYGGGGSSGGGSSSRRRSGGSDETDTGQQNVAADTSARTTLLGALKTPNLDKAYPNGFTETRIPGVSVGVGKTIATSKDNGKRYVVWSTQDNKLHVEPLQIGVNATREK